MKLYSCIAISDNVKSIEVQSFLVYAESEDKARQYTLKSFNTMIGQYPQQVKIVLINLDLVNYVL